MFEKGESVYIKSTKYTSKNIGLDERGVMKTMVGGVFNLARVKSSSRVGIRDPRSAHDFVFTWDVQDIEHAVVEEPKPNIFEYDPTNLDV